MPTGASWAGLLACLVLPFATPSVAEDVDLELVLAIDTSSSVDLVELDLQRHGLAAAFRHPAVVAAIEGNPRGVAVTVLAFSGARRVAVAVDWDLLTDAASAARYADAIDAAPLASRAPHGLTAIGDAVRAATRSILANRYEGRSRKVDVSGDGRANEGIRPELARDAAVRAGVTVNGLAILTDEPKLESYYRAHVVGGPGAFVMAAADFVDFAEAIRRKLERELAPPPLAAGTPARILARAHDVAGSTQPPPGSCACRPASQRPRAAAC